MWTSKAAVAEGSFANWTWSLPIPFETVAVSLLTLVVYHVAPWAWKFLHLRAWASFGLELLQRQWAFFAYMRLPWRRVVVSGVFPQTEGFFRYRNLDDESCPVTYYYRFPVADGGKLMRLEPSGGSGFDEEFRVNWRWSEPIPTSCGESALPDAKVSKSMDQVLWKGAFRVNTSNGVYDSMGLNIAGCALLCGHSIKGKDFVVLSGGNSKAAGVKIAVSRFSVPPSYVEGGATDFAVARLTGNEWAAIGAKALSAKDIASPNAGSIDIQFGRGSEGILFVSEGRLPQQAKAVEKAGLIFHQVSTQPGASGGALRRFVGGVPKYVGFHVARPQGKFVDLTGKYNVAISFDVILSYMRSVGLYYDSVFAAVLKAAVGESLDYDNDNVRDPLDFHRVARDCYEDEELWEATQDRIMAELYGDRSQAYEGHVGRRFRRKGGDDEPVGESLPVAVAAATVFAASLTPVLESASEEEDEAFVDADEEEAPSVSPTPVSSSARLPVPPGLASPKNIGESTNSCLSLSTVVKGTVAAAAVCLPLALDLAAVKKQVINGDFSFAPALKSAVELHGVDTIHNFVMASDAFSVYRSYMDVVQPQWISFGDVMPDENGKAFFERIGEYRVDGAKSATTPDRKKKPKPMSDVAKKRAAAIKALLEDLGCKDDEWVTPENSRANIAASMRAHAKLASVDSPSASAEDWEKAFEAGVADFDTTPLQSHAQQGFEGWYKLAATLADTSSGVSARFRRQNKKQWATDPELLLAMIDLVQCRLVLMLLHADSVDGYSPEQAVKYGLKDVLLLSVKQEPHAPRKVQQGRYRMIWISSLIDCFVQKLLHKALNARDIDNYQSGAKFHSAAGMGHHDEGIKHLCSAFDAVFGDEEFLLTCDASMWDFTMDKQAHLNHAKRRCLSCDDPAVSSLIMTLAHLNYKHVCENKGEIWRCNKEGVNTSGQSSTTADNTFSRHSQAKVCGASKFVGNGDDMVADVGFDPEAAKKFGTKSRDVVIQPADVVPFTSHHVDRKHCTASYDKPEKLAWNLLANCTSNDFGLRVDAMLSVVRNSPEALSKFKAHLGTFAKGTDTCNKDLLWAI